ncbi:GNAT family N-acetyltransferase [Arthrobacter sp. JZ12]|nr:GNAT family N-acetyltransferase [Arthrobacter sp. JZ12]
MLARVAPWLPSAREPDGAVQFRTLTGKDTAQLWDLVNSDSTANVFMAAHLEASGTAAPSTSGGEVIGTFRDSRLVSACWAGVNLVPVGMDDDDAAALGRLLGESGRRFSSIFGPASSVLGIWSTFSTYSPNPFDVREEQPLLEMRETSTVPANQSLRFTEPHELEQILPACAAMFEEEVGYSPYAGGQEHYRRRVAGLIRRRHSLVDFDDEGQVVFKAELGTVSASTAQVQGVWVNPAYRGQGLSAGYMAAVVREGLKLAPVVSLYVNSYNERALALYKSVGFQRAGEFATVLF